MQEESHDGLRQDDENSEISSKIPELSNAHNIRDNSDDLPSGFASSVNLDSEAPRQLSSSDEKGVLISLSFGPGSLGISLKRSAQGKAFVGGLIAGSQAIDMDVQPLDELWAVEDRTLGGTPLSKADWDDLVRYLRDAPRPLSVVMLRRGGGPISTPAAAAAVAVPAAMAVAVADECASIVDSGSGSADGSAEVKTAATAEAAAAASSSTSSPALVSLPPDAPTAKATTAAIAAAAAAATRQDDWEESVFSSCYLRRPEATSLLALVTGSSSSSAAAEGNIGDSGAYFPPQTWGAIRADTPLGQCNSAARTVLQQQQQPQQQQSRRRRLLLDGPVSITVPSTLWSSVQARHIFLFSDILVLALPVVLPPTTTTTASGSSSSSSSSSDPSSPLAGCYKGSHYEIHNVVDLRACKVYCAGSCDAKAAAAAAAAADGGSRLDNAVTEGEGGDGNKLAAAAASASASEAYSDADTPQSEKTFSLQCAAGSMEFACRSRAGRQRWVAALHAAVCAAVSASEGGALSAAAAAAAGGDDSSQSRTAPFGSSGGSSGGGSLGWRHRYLLGTLHSAVLGGDVDRTQQLLLAAAARGKGKGSTAAEASPANEVDTDGMSPLHYTCRCGLWRAVGPLLDGGGDPALPDANALHGWTAFHWAAWSLDHKTLALLCSRGALAGAGAGSNGNGNGNGTGSPTLLPPIDVNALSDKNGTTPLLLAITQGLGLAERANGAAGTRAGAGNVDLHLSQCITVLLAADAGAGAGGRAGAGGYTPAHFLAASSLVESLRVLLLQQHSPSASPSPSSVGAVGVHTFLNRADNEVRYSVLHSCIAGFPTRASSSSTSSSPAAAAAAAVPEPGAALMTLKILLTAGAWANAPTRAGGGIAPLSLLQQHRSRWGADLASAVALLLQYGARWDSPGAVVECGPPAVNNNSLQSALRGACGLGEVLLDTAVEVWATSPLLNIDDATPAPTPDAAAAAAGAGAGGGGGGGVSSFFFRTASPALGQRPPSPSIGNASLSTQSTADAHANNSSGSADGSSSSSGANSPTAPPLSPPLPLPPGSTSAPSEQCSLCAFKYTFFKRLHHCRVCDVPCCDYCSRRPCALGGKSVRVCDACYNRERERDSNGSARAKRAAAAAAASATLQGQGQGQGQGRRQSADKEKGTGASTSALFSGAASPTSPPRSSSTAGLGDLQNSLAQTQEALQQRGVKLEAAAERSEQLAEAAGGFAEMARQLRKQNENRWF